MKKVAILCLAVAMASSGNIQASYSGSKDSANSCYSSARLAGGCATATAATGRFVYTKYNTWQKNRELEQKKAQFYTKLKDAFIDSFIPNDTIAKFEEPSRLTTFCNKVYFYDIARLTVRHAMAKLDLNDPLYPTFDNLNQLITALYMQNNGRQTLDATTAKDITVYQLKNRQTSILIEGRPLFGGQEQRFTSPCENKITLSAFDKEMTSIMANQLYSYYTTMDNAEKTRIKQNMLQVLKEVESRLNPQSLGEAAAAMIYDTLWTDTNKNVARILRELLDK